MADSVKCGSFKLFKAGVPDGFSEIAWLLTYTPTVEGDTLCIDSSFAPPGGSWLWSTASGAIVPEWMDTLCLPVICCLGSQGNLDLSEGPGLQADISDLSAMVAYIFPPHTPLICDNVGDFDGSGGSNPVDIVDITRFVGYLFFGGAPPVICGP